jgi:hypothetical protein
MTIMARSLVCLYLLCTLLLSLYSAIPIAHAQEQANNDDSSLRAHLCAKQESTNNNYSSGAVPMQEAIPVSGIQNRHLQLFFNVTHNFGQASQEAARTRLHLELHDICTDTTAKYATYIISIYDAKNGPANASATKPIIRDIFQTASGILNLDIIDDGQAQIRIYGERDEIVNAWKADTANNSIMVKTSAIRPEATYRMELELAGIDYPTKIFAEEQSPKSTLEWDPTHTSNKIMLNPTDAGLQKSGFPYEPVTFLRTDKQHYQSGDTVSVFGNVGNGSAKALKEHKENPVRIGVLGADPQQQFVLMDNISNITDPGNFTYSFPMKGLGTIQTGRFSVQIWSPNGAQAATTYNFTYSAKEALSSNPMTVDWNDAATKHTFARVYDDRYVTNGSRLLSQSSELVFSREMRYKIIPEGSADLENLTGHHQKDGSGSTLFTILEGRLKAQRNGTLIIDIPIDVVEPDPLKVRGLEWRMLNGTAPFSVDGYGGQQRTRLLYYDEVQNVVAIEFGPGTGLFHVVGKSAEPITDSELQSGYVVPEFDSAFLVATIGLCSVVTIALVGRNQLSAK